MATISSWNCAEHLPVLPTRTTACFPSTQEHCDRDDAGMGGIDGEEEFSVCSTSATTVRASNVSEKRRKLLLTMSEHEDILCDADAAFTRLQVPPFVVEQFFYMISNDGGEVALQPLALFLDFQVSLGRMLVDERDEAVEHGRRVVSIPVDAVRAYWSTYCLPVRRTVVPNILAGMDTKGSDEISSLSGNGNGSGIAGLQAGDSKTNATNAGVAVQVANAKDTKEEKSTDIEDVELSMEENNNTVLTSSVGFPMEECSGSGL